MPKHAKQDRLEHLQEVEHEEIPKANKPTPAEDVDDSQASRHEDGTLLLRQELERAASLLPKAEVEQEQRELDDAVDAALRAAEHVARPLGGSPDDREHDNAQGDQPRNLGAFDAGWWVFTPVGMSLALWMTAWQRYGEWLNETQEKFSATDAGAMERSGSL